MLKSRFRKTGLSSFDNEDVNPMEGVANLSDAMLVLAVGIMLALIIAWKLDWSTVANNYQQVQSENLVELEQQAETLSNWDSDDAQAPEDYGLHEAGKLYMDDEGNYYILGH